MSYYDQRQQIKFKLEQNKPNRKEGRKEGGGERERDREKKGKEQTN